MLELGGLLLGGVSERGRLLHYLVRKLAAQCGNLRTEGGCVTTGLVLGVLGALTVRLSLLLTPREERAGHFPAFLCPSQAFLPPPPQASRAALGGAEPFQHNS